MDEESNEELEPRPPTEADFAALCGALNQRGAKYVVIGGFAMIHAGFPRFTGDVDLLIAVDPENERKVLDALATLPDKAALELGVGEIERFTVVRVADEILVDLMASASGIKFAEAISDAVYRDVGGQTVPFASPRMLWRMKVNTHREKDIPDLLYLKEWFAERGEQPPETTG